MTKIFALMIAGLLTTTAVVSAQGVHVDGYAKRDGTYIQPSYRSAPDHSYNNNYGVSPNTNPYTGTQGTRQPTYNDRPPQSNSFGSEPYRSRSPAYR